MPRFNINSSNNHFTYSIKEDNINENLILIEGKYTIETLLSSINKELKQHNIEFSIGNDQKVIIKSNKMFKLDPSTLLVNVLGIYDFSFTNELKAKNLWDLRIPNKVYLYLTNLQRDIPFGILYFHNINTCQISFRNPISLNNLEIKFKDENSNLYDFNGLSHNLSFQLEVIENTEYTQLNQNNTYENNKEQIDNNLEYYHQNDINTYSNDNDEIDQEINFDF